MPQQVQAAKIFLSYARTDEEMVENLYSQLRLAGFAPWMDTMDILAGEDWRQSIEKAIRESHFFLACLSRHSIDKRGWVQREIRIALEMWQERLHSDIYLIPVRLESCVLPDKLRQFQWVDLYEPQGVTQLTKAILEGMRRLDLIQPISLRANAVDGISIDDAIKIIKDRDFFHKEWNWRGQGIVHVYEPVEHGGIKLVIDHTTGLTWQQSGSNHEMNMNAANEYVARLNQGCYANYADWRLPTLEEAMSLLEPQKINDLHINPAFDKKQYWLRTADRFRDTSTKWAYLIEATNLFYDTWGSWIVDFKSGYCMINRGDDDYFVRAVRG